MGHEKVGVYVHPWESENLRHLKKFLISKQEFWLDLEEIYT